MEHDPKLYVEIADTPKTLAYGLMNRKDLDYNSGMLFIFPEYEDHPFWGKNTLIHLDIAFIKDNKILKISNIKKECLDRVSCGEKYNMALEVNRGYFGNWKILPGYHICLHQNEKDKFIKFSKKNKIHKFLQSVPGQFK